jgi:hypothetical protein
MGLKAEVVKECLRCISDKIGDGTDLAAGIAQAAADRCRESLGAFTEDFRRMLRETADAANPADLTEEDRVAFRRLADVLDAWDYLDGFYDVVDEAVQEAVGELGETFKPFWEWAAKHGITIGETRWATALGRDVVDLNRDEYGDLVVPAASTI